MPLSRRHRGSTINIWPGFVDALAQLLMVIIFVLLVFTVGQFYLSGTVSDRDTEIRTLTRQLNNLSDMLSLDKRESDDLRQNVATLQLNLQQAAANQDQLTSQLAAANAKAQSEAQALAKAQGQLDDAQKKLTAAQGDVGARDTTIATLNQNVEALRQQLADLAKALDLSQTENKTQQGQIADLGQKLNLALAAKVENLAQYRSEFFGRLRQILGDRQDIRIVGDRFVFQSEVLFDPGSADLEPGARQQLAPVVAALREIAGKIPPNLHWILEVEGHTDRHPINTPQFKSNWELSSARAVTVTNYLISQGIPPDHLAAAGFAEWQPLDTGDTPDALRHNRRIELKLTQR